jgi:sugar phosphate isomerase/epimerase
MKVGLVTDSLRVPFEEAVAFAVEAGADGIQPYVVSGPMAAWTLDSARRREIRDRVTGAGLEFAALCGDLGGGYTPGNDTVEKWERIRAVLGLAAEWGAPVVSGHIGVIPAADNADRQWMAGAMRRLGGLAREAGVRFGVETGPEPAGVLRGFLEEVGEPGLRVNFDPANLVMVQGESAAEGVAELAPFLAHCHAKDGKRLKPFDPARLYRGFAEIDETFLRTLDTYFIETPCGEGDVDFPAFVRALRRVGYDGYLTVERESGDRRKDDMCRAVRLLRECLRPA